MASRNVRIARMGPDFGVTSYASSAFQLMYTNQAAVAFVVHCGFRPAVPSLGGNAAGPMWILDVTGQISREGSSKFFVRVVGPVMLLDQIEDQPIGLFAHLRPHSTPPS